YTYAQEKDTVKTANVEEVVILGSRSGARSKVDSPVPVDVFNIKESSLVLPQTNISQILNAIAPSFTSTVQTNSDGTDHLDPAQLRGLGPDQVLVLVNGKRRHTSALVNVNGTPGRGTVGTDLNAIPSFAINRIEVLRDGAAAQYGSDAIAGVINLGLKRDTGKLTGQFTYGGNLTPAANNHTGNFDGQNFQVDLNYG
ncbi:TonB-dependent receptor plug domain-containing protein, partial [Salmonella enterica subsp. enterica serovar Derby]|nr:TonB-dependent receptor plug domain-containing protein [Salmonella enterica subsp. enterica serovar Derby]